MSGRIWQDMSPADFDTTPAPLVQLALFAEPDALGTPDMFDAEGADDGSE